MAASTPMARPPAAAVRFGIGQRIDHAPEFEDRARPAMRQQQRHRAGMRRAHKQEVDVQPVQRGDELRVPVQQRLALRPVIACRPVLADGLHLFHVMTGVNDAGAAGRPRGDGVQQKMPRLSETKIHVLGHMKTLQCRKHQCADSHVLLIGTEFYILVIPNITNGINGYFLRCIKKAWHIARIHRSTGAQVAKQF
jgi:hypothetical protein